MEKLEKARAACQGWLSRVCVKMDRLLAKSPPATSSELVEVLEEFDKRLNKLEEVQSEIELEISPEALEEYLDKADAVRQQARQKRLLCADKLKKLAEGDKDKSDSSSTTAPLHAKLPKLELPRFDGDLKQWQSFWEQFSSHIDDTELPTISKLTYLLSLLDGTAKDVVEGVPHTCASYKTVVDLLKQRFGKSECIIHAHVQALLDLQVPVHQGKTYILQLWRLRDEVVKHTRSLEAQGVTGKQCEVLLTPMIVSRLPTELRLNWSRDCSGHESDLEWLLSWLQREIEVIERSEMYKGNVKSLEGRKGSKDSKEVHKGNKEKLFTASALHVTSPPERSDCVFCSKRNHKSEKCYKFLVLDGQQRFDKIRELGVCFRCLNSGHKSRSCKAKCSKCRGDHNSTMCGVKLSVVPKAEVEESKQTGTQTLAMLSGHYRNKTVLQTAKVKVVNHKGDIVTARLMFDNGCDRSYVTNKFVGRCKPEWVTNTEVPYSSFGGHSSSKCVQSSLYKLKLLDDKGDLFSLVLAGIPIICEPLIRPVVPEHILSAFNHLKFADDFDHSSPLDLDILIGLDYYWSLVTPSDAVQVGLTVALKSVFGWTLSGNTGKFSDTTGVPLLPTFKPSSPQLLCISKVTDADMSNFWDLETIGISSSKESKEDVRDKIVQEYSDKIKFVDGRYEVHLPWKDNPKKDTLMSNEVQAKKRLNKLLVKLDKDEDLKAEYMKVFAEYEHLGIIEEVPVEEIVHPGPVYYMPHRPVVRLSSSTTKVRPVFDASAKGPNGISLNDCMTTGPSLNPDLVEILIRYRRWPYVVTADIVKAFLQISVQSQDRNVHRFFMPAEGGVRHMRFTRVVFGNTSSPFLLNATIKTHLSKYSECEVIQDLQRDMYVDNWFSGADSEVEAVRKYTTAYNIMSEANMSLEKLVSNSLVIASKCNDKVHCVQDDEVNSVLGLKWSKDSDVFSYCGLDLDFPLELACTKRTVLSLIAKIFDPCGFISPFTMYAKILFQDIWKSGVSWDDKLSQDLEVRFEKWVRSTRHLSPLVIGRHYFPHVPWKSIEFIEIHGFGDASEKGYGACVYLRLCLDSACNTSLVVSKSRVAPIKKLTLPKLELLGALLCARLVVFVKKALYLKIKTQVTCWTDSTIALGWIRNDPSLKDVYVNNRVREIQHLTPPSNWYHCKGTENPADLITRGLLAESLLGNDLWFSGPKYLSDPTFRVQERDALTASINTVNVVLENNLACLAVQTRTPIFDLERYNDLAKSLRIVGYVLRFINNCKSKRLGCELETCRFTTEELEFAELKLIYVEQRQAFPDEIKAISSERSLPKHSKLSKLNPFLDQEGILRIKGRLQFSSLGYNSKHPIILPKGHFSKLLVQFQHKFMKHAGVNSIVSSLRTSFWVIGLRRMAKTVVRECLSCRRHDSRPCSQPVAPLPDLRVNPAPPFAVTGLDFTGPLFSADHPGKKLYVLLFTCAVIRAVHLELTESMSLVDCMRAIRRFVARRGIPNVFYSDNAKTFVAASTEVQKVFGHLAPRWKFNVPRSPWWGGWFERLIGSVKLALRKSLGVKYVSQSELETILIEIESCINSRPLTFVSDDPDFDHYLTPSHFILGRNSTCTPSDVDESPIISPEDLYIRKNIRNQRLEHFWKVWREDYIANLPPVVKGFNQKCKVDVGSVVLIRGDNVPRQRWPMGVIVNVYPGRDGVIRSVDVKTGKGIFNRTIQTLHDLEINPHLDTDVITPQPVLHDQAVQDDVTSSVANDDSVQDCDPEEEEEEEEVAVYTSRGRLVKRPHRLDL